MQGMERKVQQLTKVIYHLNAKGEEARDLPDTTSQYENEIEGILRDASERVKRFQAACAHTQDVKAVQDKVREVEQRYEAQRIKTMREFEEFKKRATAAQVCVVCVCVCAWLCARAHVPVAVYARRACRHSLAQSARCPRPAIHSARC